MSNVLEPVHYWLYDKIGKQEDLTMGLAALAENRGWIENKEHYTKRLPLLDTAADKENIEGWFQKQISDAETRFAALIMDSVRADCNRLDDFCRAAFTFGMFNALHPNTDAEAAYKAFEDFFLSGMPDEQVIQLKVSSSQRVDWEETQDVHAAYWTKWEDGSAPYYRVRKSVMEGMLHATSLQLLTPDNSHFSLTKMVIRI